MDARPSKECERRLQHALNELDRLQEDFQQARLVSQQDLARGRAEHYEALTGAVQALANAVAALAHLGPIRPAEKSHRSRLGVLASVRLPRVSAPPGWPTVRWRA